VLYPEQPSVPHERGHEYDVEQGREGPERPPALLAGVSGATERKRLDDEKG
jgi:hypothetical protein